jgi:di/tricarboxylate transporter
MSLTLFLVTDLGIAPGEVPGLVIDRVGIALLGAIAMVGFGVVSTESAFQSVDRPTILMLCSLMAISFSEHARVGVPATFMSLIVLVVWDMV